MSHRHDRGTGGHEVLEHLLGRERLEASLKYLHVLSQELGLQHYLSWVATISIDAGSFSEDSTIMTSSGVTRWPSVPWEASPPTRVAWEAAPGTCPPSHVKGSDADARGPLPRAWHHLSMLTG